MFDVDTSHILLYASSCEICCTYCLFQLPIFISVYKGIREMAELPVVSMKSGGLFWFTDLTVADPYFALPLMTVATLLVTIEVRTQGSCGSLKTDMVLESP